MIRIQRQLALLSLAAGLVAAQLLPAETSTNPLIISPAAISLSATSGVNSLVHATLSLTSSTSMRISVSATGSTNGVTWLTVSPAGSGRTPETITVTANPSGLATGTYSGSVAIRTNETTHRVPVTFTISAPKTLTVNPSTLSLSTTFGASNPVSGTVNIGATPSAAFSTAVSGGSWLSVSPVSGTTPAPVTVASAAGSLGAGTYSGSISITGNGITDTVPVTFTVAKASQSIQFSLASPVSYGSNSLVLSAIATSGLPVSFSASPAAVCTASGNTLTIAGVGTCAVTASQSGNANYAGAAPVSQALVINQAAQTINFVQPATPLTYSANLTVPLVATSSSGLPVTFALDSSSTGTGSILGSTLSVSGAGTLVVDANQGGNADFAPAPQVSRSVVINPASNLSVNPQSLAFTGSTGGSVSAPQSLSISANPATTFNVTVSGAPWLTVTPASGSTPSTLTVSPSLAGVSAGNYNGTLTITTAGGLTSTVGVSLAVSSPSLSVSPSSLSYSAIAGGSSQALESVEVTTSSSFTVMTGGLSWLSASPTSGTGPSTVTVTANTTGVAAGTYSGSIVVMGSGATVTVPITVTIAPAGVGGPFRLVSWNDLGMHCFDGKDYSVFGVLPPYNTIHAHLIDTSGSLVSTPDGYTIEYQAITDQLTGTITSTSAPKTNFWDYSSDLSLGSPAPDVGITGNAMPGTTNKPQPMSFSTSDKTWVATGVPEMPYADNGTTNYFPMMRVTARNSSGAVVATTDVVLPTSDEMSCRTCHGSNTNPAAEPKAGWVNDPDPARDVKLNILRRHDDNTVGTTLFQSASSQLGFNPAGLEATARSRPILCAQCHGSNALGMAGVSGINPLTQAMHGRHAAVVDPATNATMDSSTVRTTCYSCHPGPKTQCLRGAMGTLQNSSGGNAIECQSCHGNLTAVANPARNGWLNEPACQSCHSGLASSTNTTLAYTSVFTSGTTVRTPADSTFATNTDTPATGLSLYRFSSGHGGLQCEACHGSTHAEFPSAISNDNVQSINLQGHAGMLSECTACHKTIPSTTNGGPHGLHPIGTVWVSQHQNVAELGTTTCQGCHGTDYRGTILSRVKTDRTMAGKSFPSGTIIGCYSCHNGPNGD